MGRAPRLIGADLTYHVTMRGNRRVPIFLDHQDRRKFCALLRDVVQTRSWIGWAWCLMGNHVHLCFTTPEPNLSDGLRDLFGQYARFFNWKYSQPDHLFRSRYHSVTVTSDEQLLAVIRYVARNPVRAGLVEHPEEWEWSSYTSVLLGTSGPVPIDVQHLLELFHRRPLHARTLLRQLVELPEPHPHEFQPRAGHSPPSAIAQVMEPRKACAILIEEGGMTVAEASRLTGASVGAIRAWKRNGYARDQRRR